MAYVQVIFLFIYPLLEETVNLKMLVLKRIWGSNYNMGECVIFPFESCFGVLSPWIPHLQFNFQLNFLVKSLMQSKHVSEDISIISTLKGKLLISVLKYGIRKPSVGKYEGEEQELELLLYQPQTIDSAQNISGTILLNLPSLRATVPPSTSAVHHVFPSTPLHVQS